MTSDPNVGARLASPSSPASRNQGDASVAPTVVWILLQLIPLVLAAFRVPLSARFPQPAERLALHEMLIAQIVFAAMLFPWLLRSRGAVIAVIVTGWPFVMLAGVLADADGSRMLVGTVYVTGWLVALALLAGAMRESSRVQLVAVALVNCLTLGGPIVWYLVAESGHRAPAILAATPVIAVVNLLAAPVWIGWISLAAYLGTGGIALAIAWRK